MINLKNSITGLTTEMSPEQFASLGKNKDGWEIVSQTPPDEITSIITGENNPPDDPEMIEALKLSNQKPKSDAEIQKNQPNARPVTKPN